MHFFDGIPYVFQCMIGNPCVNGECTNKGGGYNCDCFKGYIEEEGVCLDINEVPVSNFSSDGKAVF